MTYRPSPFQRGLAALNDLACVILLVAALYCGCRWLVDQIKPQRPRTPDYTSAMPQSAAILARLKAR